MANRNLHSAKAKKKDEFYTQLSDIANELRHYRQHFRGKVIYCNCDDPTVSNFFHYFAYSFRKLGLKKLITTCYKNQERDLFSQHDAEKAIWLEYDGQLIENRIPDPEQIGVNYLEDDGDFRSAECVELLKQADIVVTNPPFSLFREYVTQLIKYDKKFLIIGNMNAVTYKEIFPLIKENKLWYGVNTGGVLEFGMPKHYPLIGSTARTDEDGNKFVKVNGTKWFTNLPHRKRNDEIILTEYYSPDKYPKYDNYDAIEVGKTMLIPRDYDGAMGVPISFLDKYNPNQFEIVGATQRGCHDDIPDTRKYDDYWEVRQDGTKTGSSGGKTNENANLVGNDGRKNYFINSEGRIIQSAYQRIFIRRKRGR